MNPKTRIAILGGGIGSLSAAYHLTRTPQLRAQYDVTIYQMGWRLGGQCASGRNRERNDRVEEHGLHIWMGWYANAFATMRECYAEWVKEPCSPLQELDDALRAQIYTPIGLGDGRTFFEAEWPTNADVPGKGGVGLSEWGAITQALGIVRVIIHQLLERLPQGELCFKILKPLFYGLWEVVRLVWRLAWVLRFRPIKALRHILRWLFRRWHVKGMTDAAQPLSIDLMRDTAPIGIRAQGLVVILKVAHGAMRQLFGAALKDKHASLIVGILDTAVAILRGLLSEEILAHHDLNLIDDHEFRCWLIKHGARETINDLKDAPELRALYDLAFAYEPCGPVGKLKPNFAAGTAVRALIRIFGTYKGAPLFLMQAGMGETVMAPLYEVLSARGVHVKFFHKVRKLELSETKNWVERIHLNVQAQVKGGADYDPLYTVKGARCWPSEPFWEQLVGGDRMRAAHVNFDSHWCQWPVARPEVLELGTHFDKVILGINAGAFKELNTADGSICAELIAASKPFEMMTTNLGLIPTFGVQLWMTRTLAELGWKGNKPAMVGAVEPMDVWADMSQLLAGESWPPIGGPRSLHFFCGPWGTVLHRKPAAEEGVPAEAYDAITGIAETWLTQNTKTIWPCATKKAENPEELNWDLLYDGSGAIGADRLSSQWIRPNVDPTECCVASWAGTTQYRLRAGESGFLNLVLTGTWTRNGMNATCVEAAVMSGMAAARAISGQPKDIVGEYFLQSR